MKKTNEGKKREFPHIFIVLFLMMIVALIATWIVPSGVYDRVALEGSTSQVVVTDSFHYIEKEYLSPFFLLKAVTNGLTGSALVIFTILIIGACWQVINATGAISVGIHSIARKLKGKEMMIFPILMFVFAFIAAVIGGAELMLVYLPAVMPLMLALGFDTMSAAGMVVVAGFSAFSVSVTNPFTVGIGDEITGLPLYSGAWYRIILQVVFYLAGVLYVLNYARKVRKDGKNSLVYEESAAFAKTYTLSDEVRPSHRDMNCGMPCGYENQETQVQATSRHKWIGVALVIILAVMIYGIISRGWYMEEINGLFLIAAIVSAVIGKMSMKDVCEHMVEGAKGVVAAGIVCGLSRGIMVILEAGSIIDVIIHSLSEVVSVLPGSIAVIGIFLIQLLFNFLVNSGSGQFLITMPILAPLATLVGINSQTMILASQMGDGFTNMLFPTSGVLMACLAFAKVPYEKWVKFIAKYMVIVTLLGCISLVIAQMIDYGPF